jgi:hypothetical protein
MATAKTPAKSPASKKAAKKAAPAAADAPLILKRETVADLQALLKQALRPRQSRKVCVA